MANHPSAEKRNRQRIKRTDRNRNAKSAVRTIVKKVRAALQAKDKTQATATLKDAIVALDRAGSKGVLHKKTASRRISRLAKSVHKLG
ncbi:MAG: 30S ribosomal protein S20 [Polyangiaceae bacterium]